MLVKFGYVLFNMTLTIIEVSSKTRIPKLSTIWPLCKIEDYKRIPSVNVMQAKAIEPYTEHQRKTQQAITYMYIVNTYLKYSTFVHYVMSVHNVYSEHVVLPQINTRDCEIVPTTTCRSVSRH